MNRWGCLGNVMRRRYANEAENKLTHADCRIRNTHTHARTHHILAFSIYTRIVERFQFWLDYVHINSKARSEVWYKEWISLSYYSQIFLPPCAWVPCKWAWAGKGGKERQEEGGRGGWEGKRGTLIEVGRHHREIGKKRGMEGGQAGCKGGVEEGISHIEMRVLLSVFSLSPCITPWITTTPPQRWRNVRTPLYTHKHTHTYITPFLSIHPLLFTK